MHRLLKPAGLYAASRHRTSAKRNDREFFRRHSAEARGLSRYIFPGRARPYRDEAWTWSSTASSTRRRSLARDYARHHAVWHELLANFAAAELRWAR